MANQLRSEDNSGSTAAKLDGVPNIEFVRRQMFVDFCQLMDGQEIPYVICSGCAHYPEQIDSDVDFMVSEQDFARLPTLFRQAGCIPGTQLLQVLQHETSGAYYIFSQAVGARLAFLHPDAAASYRRRGRLWLRSGDVLANRRKSPNGFWIPAPEVEFHYYLVKRIDKAKVEERHLQTLAALLAENPEGCAKVLAGCFGNHASRIREAIADRDVSWFADNKQALRADLSRVPSLETALSRLASRLKNALRIVHRIVRPTGLVLAVLGPDGSGKTTIIEHLERELAPAFRSQIRFHLRPHFGRPKRNDAPVVNPHAQAPRGRLASEAKAALFLLDYWFGWLRSVYPAKIKSTFVVFDRYYHDMLVDKVRYRLPKQTLLVRALAPLVPPPDLWLILDAPPEVLVARKGEISLEVAIQLTASYRQLATDLPNARLVESGGGLEETLIHAVAVVQGHLAKRMAERG